MRLKVNREEDGLPRVEIYFEEDGEPYMVLDAYGFYTDDEISMVLKDVARSIDEQVPTELIDQDTRERAIQEFDLKPPEHIPFSPQPLGKMSEEGRKLMADLEAQRRPGETVRDVERRTRPSFNPRPRAQRT
jgi:hypothetical protein